jgi:hypothetical protein
MYEYLYFSYMPGQGQLVLFSFTLFGNKKVRVLIQIPLDYVYHGCATFSGKRPQPLLLNGLQGVHVKITKCRIHNFLMIV